MTWGPLQVSKMFMKDLHSNILKYGFLPIADKAMRTTISVNYRQIKLMQSWSKEDITQWQNNRLKKLIDHAYNHTKYYKELFDRIGIKPDDITSAGDLKKLPVLTKADIRAKFNDFMPDIIQSIPYKQSATGGSTGDPMSYLIDRQSSSFSNANKIYNWERTGYRYGQNILLLEVLLCLLIKKDPINIYYITA